MSFARKIFIASALLAATAAPALAEGIEISNGWTRVTVRGASVGVGYMTIDNQSGAADTLASASCDCAGRVEIHESVEKAGLMTMRALPKGVEIKAGKQLALKPGGHHLMLVGLKGPFVLGDTVHMTLHFAKAGDIGADLKVQPFGAQGLEAPKPAAKPAGKPQKQDGGAQE
jgi:copper(I)-binding protein